MTVHSKLEGSVYKDCPLCGVSTNIGNHVENLNDQIKVAYDVLSARNEMIHNLQKKLSDLRSETEKITGTNLQEH
jgi:hypothetical protein